MIINKYDLYLQTGCYVDGAPFAYPDPNPVELPLGKVSALSLRLLPENNCKHLCSKLPRSNTMSLFPCCFFQVVQWNFGRLSQHPMHVHVSLIIERSLIVLYFRTTLNT